MNQMDLSLGKTLKREGMTLAAQNRALVLEKARRNAQDQKELQDGHHTEDYRRQDAENYNREREQADD